MPRKSSKSTSAVRPSSTQPHRFLLVVLVALVVWSCWPSPSVSVLLVAYVIGLLVTHVLLRWTNVAQLFAQLSRSQRWFLLTLFIVFSLAAVWRVVGSLSPDDQIATWRENVADRLALQQTPSIAPRVIVDQHPQRFFVHAPDKTSVKVFFSPDEPTDADSLGDGLFQVDFDPLKTSLPEGVLDGPITITLEVDGKRVERELTFARAQPHPRWFSSATAAGVAATVSEETDELIVVRRDGRFNRIPVGDGPSDCAIFDQGKQVAVCHRYCPELWVVDVESGKVSSKLSMPRFQVRLAVSPDENLMAIAIDGERRGIQLVTLPDLQPTNFLQSGLSPDWITFGRGSGEIVATSRPSRVVFRWEDREGIWRLGEDFIELPRPVITICRDENGEGVLLATTAPFPMTNPIIANHFVQNTIHRLELPTWKVADTLITDRRGVGQESAGDTYHGVSPMGMTVADGTLLVAMAGSNEVLRTPASLGGLESHFSLDPLSAPHGIAVLGEGAWCVSSPIDGVISVFQGDELKSVIQLSESDVDLAKSDPEAFARRRGERTFYETTRAGISCQSCHPSAHTDYCQHDIGQGLPSDVLSVRGIIGTSPYLRDASNGRLRDLHETAEFMYRGYRRQVDWDRGDALVAFMSGLPPVVHPRTLEPGDLPRLRAGFAAFRKASCVRCHVPPAMTNLGLHPTRFLFPEYGEAFDVLAERHSFLDTPSLRSVSVTPPYLHDGRAATLTDVLRTWNKAGRHGDPASLTDQEFDALLYFLEQL